MSQSPAPIVPQTRQKTATTTAKKTQKDLENADGLNTNIRTKEQATEFLIAKEYLNPGKPTDLQTLSHILFQLGHPTIRMPKALTDGIRVVAFLLADASAQQMANMITATVKSQLQECMTVFTAEVETMRDAVEHVTVAVIDIKGKMEDFNKGFQETADQLAQATHKLMEKTAENANTITEKSLTQNHQQPTYATITQQQDPPAHTVSVITRGEITNKQILIQKDPNTTNNTLESLSEKDLVAKANMTLDLMGIEAADKPPGTTFVGAKKLRNGNVLYQLNSKDAADWMKELEVQTAFMVNYGGTANIWNKLFYVIAEFVLTTFDAGSSYTHAKVEEDSVLGTGAIPYSKYIKPPHLRANGQKVAHVIFGFNSHWGANSMIEFSMFIEGKHSNVHKMLTEPCRCLKCQRFGHYGPDCKATTDTCAQCGEQHKMALCNVMETASFKCANCKDPGAKGHGAADRKCLAFKTEKDKIQERVPENKYNFFPTVAPNTWRLLNKPEPLIGNEQIQT